MAVDRVARGSTDVVLAGERVAESELCAATFSRYVPHRTVAFVEQGGHVGFLDGALGGSSWAERRALAFLRRLLLP